LEDLSLRNKDNIKRAQRDNEFAGKLLEANDKLIWYTVNKYIGSIKYLTSFYPTIEAQDILQEGRYAMLRALKVFDSDINNNFTAFAMANINVYVKAYLRDKGSFIRFSRLAFKNLMQIYKIKAAHGPDIHVTEIAKLLGVECAYITKLLGVKEGYLPIEDELLNAEMSNTDVGDLVISESSIMNVINYKDLLTFLITTLPPLEWAIVEQLIMGFSLQDISRELCLTRAELSEHILHIQEVVVSNV
jgi:RNA polymerase sigma factor (sigma-70 family)